jgi:hypothetical protein
MNNKRKMKKKIKLKKNKSKKKKKRGCVGSSMVVQAYNLSTQEVETRGL